LESGKDATNALINASDGGALQVEGNEGAYGENCELVVGIKCKVGRPLASSVIALYRMDSWTSNRAIRVFVWLGRVDGEGVRVGRASRRLPFVITTVGSAGLGKMSPKLE